MAFQEQVNRYRAVGIAGQAATPDQSVYTAKNYLSDGTAKIGCFVFADTETPNHATATGTAGPVLGLVERNIVYPIYDVSKGALDTAPEGYGLTIAVRGDYYVQSTSATNTVGNAVFASLTDGTIQTGTAGSTVSGCVETPWTVKDVLEAGTAKGLILISNWNTTVAAGGAGGAASVNFDLGQATGTLAVAHGGTGSTSAEAARTALGLGTLATKNSPLAVADGGTGATDAANAKTNLEIA